MTEEHVKQALVDSVTFGAIAGLIFFLYMLAMIMVELISLDRQIRKYKKKPNLGWRAGWFAHLFNLHSPSAFAIGYCWCQRKLNKEKSCDTPSPEQPSS